MNSRHKALTSISYSEPRGTSEPLSQNFGKYVFNLKVMQKYLSKEVFENVELAMNGLEPIKTEYADLIAIAMKDWAVNLGATHYSHWFQPLTGSYAEKHDAFIDCECSESAIEKFSGNQLVQGEPDASSFPCGGLRSTYEARGYTGWDPTSPPFIWKAGGTTTLCIPSVFFSWTGDVLDAKIPLLRSNQAINKAAIRLLKHCKIPAKHIFPTLGLEQEYFIIDRSLRNLRPDLLLSGRTVFGAASPKGQELQDHYFGAVKDRILNYMNDFETEAIKLGIPLRTRHNEVAPSQHEAAPLFERSSLAIDHNILLMEIMRRRASFHNLACLLHEKPFSGINGSGKHMNWSLSTDSGFNLLNPSDTPGRDLYFIILLAAILNGVYEHSALLSASIGSASNDFRLGGHEAPPAIISVYLGREIEGILEAIEKKGFHTDKNKNDKYNLGLLNIPDLTKAGTDRNRTSPFAFTGSKFEFRALGSSASPAMAATVLNLIVAESLEKILDEIEKDQEKTFTEASLPVIRKYLMRSKNIRFAGDNYSEAWVKEAKSRGLPHFKKSYYAFQALIDPKTIDLFKGVLTKAELESRYEIAVATYAKTVNIEINLMIDMFQTQIYPAAISYQKELAEGIEAFEDAVGKSKLLTAQKNQLKELAELIQKALMQCQKLKKVQAQALKYDVKKQAKEFAEKVLEEGFIFREIVDSLEENIKDELWPLPKYRELLFMT